MRDNVIRTYGAAVLRRTDIHIRINIILIILVITLNIRL